MLENDAKEARGNYEGIYTFHGFSDGIDYWMSEGEIVLWYRKSSTSQWRFAPLAYLGSYTAGIKSVPGKLEKECPNNEGYVWNWVYSTGGSYIATNDVYIKCANEDDFCTSENPCGTDEGDCDTHDECQVNLFCGSNNCPNYLGFHSEFDCCYAPAIGDEHFCSPTNPCGQHEGDCDSTNECQTNLICDTAHSSPAYLGFMSDVNICVNISEVSRCK